MKRKPHGYQRRAGGFLWDNPESGAFLEPGLGKSSISLDLILKLKKEDPSFRGALVVAPLRPAWLVWPKELRKWDQFKSLSYTVLHGSDKDEKFERDRDVYIINPEGLDWLLDKLHGKRVTSWPFSVVFVDESTKFKNPRTLRFKNLRRITKKLKRKHLLTGTPAPRGLRDLFGQFLVMDDGKTFGTTKGGYENKYFYKSGYMGHELKLYPGADNLIYKKMAPKVIQMKAEDYLDLPELVFNQVDIELPKSARELYNKIEKDFILKFEDGKVTAANAGVLSSKCRQIACGGVYLDDLEQRWKNVHDEKTKACADLIEEINGSPTLLAYEFRHDLDRLTKTFGTGIPTIKSRLGMVRTKHIEDSWNRGEIDLLFGQSTSIALGLNLQDAGNTLIVHTLPWSYETWYQLVRRLYRQGQKAKRVIVHVLIAKGTVEEAVWKSLQGNEKTHVSLFDSLKGYWSL